MNSEEKRQIIIEVIKAVNKARGPQAPLDVLRIKIEAKDKEIQSKHNELKLDIAALVGDAIVVSSAIETLKAEVEKLKEGSKKL